MQIKETMREFDDDRQELVMTMVASAEEVDESSKKFFADLQKREYKGFRKGKAPRTVLEQAVGGHANAMGGVAEQLINDLARKAIDDADVIFIEEPQFNVENTLEEGKPFTFSVSGPVAPIMKLTDYSPVTIEMPPEEVTDAEIDAQLRALQDYYHSYKDIEDPDHEAALGDYVMLTLTITDKDDKVVSGIAAQSRMIGLGEGTMPESFDEHILGAKAGETREFDFDARNPDGTSSFGDGDLHAVVDIKRFRELVLPDLDDELAIKVGCMDAEDMRKEMKRNIGLQKSQELPKMKADRAIAEIIKRLDGDVPDYYLNVFREDVSRELMKNLQDDGTNLQQWMLQNSLDGDAVKEDIEREAVHRAKIDRALDAVFDEQGLEVTEEDIDAMFEGEDGPEVRKQWEDAARMSDVRKIARQTKATEWLTSTAEVNVVDYAEITAKAKEEAAAAAKEKDSKKGAKKTGPKAKAEAKDDDDVLEISFGDSIKLNLD